MDSTTPAGGEITHVSDTTLMAAACRGLENEQEDAFVRDAFAARLAGERGLAILNALPHAAIFRFGVAIRTRFVDELLLEALAAHSIHTVLSAGCGLDTRPWRLALPPDLRWIEIDFAEMLDYKERLMADEAPRCRRERLSVDMNDAAQRSLIYATAGAEPSLMITEALLMYLPAGTVEALAAETSSRNSIVHWISDITTSGFSRAVSGGDNSAMQSIRRVQASDALPGEQILDVLGRYGWRMAASRSYITDVGFTRDRVRRMMGGADPPRPPIPPGDVTGVHRFARVWSA